MKLHQRYVYWYLLYISFNYWEAEQILVFWNSEVDLRIFTVWNSLVPPIDKKVNCYFTLYKIYELQCRINISLISNFFVKVHEFLNFKFSAFFMTHRCFMVLHQLHTNYIQATYKRTRYMQAYLRTLLYVACTKCAMHTAALVKECLLIFSINMNILG